MILPLDLIVLTSRCFESAADLLSFALICKRHSVILSKIHDKNNKESLLLLRLYSRKLIGIFENEEDEDNNELGSVILHYILPNHTTHGPEVGWRLDKEYIAQLVQLKGEYENLSDTRDEELKFSTYVTTPENQKQAEEILKKHGRLAFEAYEYFGTDEGKFKSYHDIADRVALRNERDYCDNALNGLAISYDIDGRVTSKLHYHNDKAHGPRYQFNYGQITLSNYVDDFLEGEVEVYETRFDDDDHSSEYRVLTQRSKYHRSLAVGPTELWNSVTGIKTKHSNHENGATHGQVDEWSGETGVKIRTIFFVKGKKDGPEEQFHRVTGKRTVYTLWKNGQRDGVNEFFLDGKVLSRQQWKADLRDGPQEIFHDVTGNLIEVSHFVQGRREGTCTRWDEQGEVVEVTHWHGDQQVEPESTKTEASSVPTPANTTSDEGQ